MDTKCSNITLNDKAVLNAIFNPLLPTDEADDKVENDVPYTSSEVKLLESEGVKAAEKGDIDGALALFLKALDRDPNCASVYNNKAQALRLKGDVNGALCDLNRAIDLSNGQGKAACQAHAQRGLIHMLHRAEDAAREDFKRAAALGSSFAKTQLVMMNPYAAMCNKMLSDVLGKLQRGEPEDADDSEPPG